MLSIKKIDVFVLKQFSLLFVGTFFICQFVLMMQFLWRYVDTLIGKGISMDIMAQFFWYMGLFLVPQAFPLAILLSSLITFGNLGESLELTAIKAAGISLKRIFAPIAIASCLIAIGSFFFQNNIGPNANQQLSRLLLSMKHNNPELEIPEGFFYDGIPQCNIYVEKKNKETGHLYGVMIYRMTNSFDDAAIILADSGMIQSTADKKHLLLTLYTGEWFENMRAQEFTTNEGVPYRRESFIKKTIVIDFDDDFNLADANSMMSNAKAKSNEKIQKDLDSLKNSYDSIGHLLYKDAKMFYYSTYYKSKRDSLTVKKQIKNSISIDDILKKQSLEKNNIAMQNALTKVKQINNDLEYKIEETSIGDRLVREHKIELISKYSLALSCVIFFFIGAPLGAIIRKGGLGIPVIISVLVFIIYYILDNTGYRMARLGSWDIWIGKSLSTIVLAPLAAFFTIKANKDSMVFNIEQWLIVIKKIFQRLYKNKKIQNKC